MGPVQRVRLATEAAGAAHVVDRSSPSEEKAASRRHTHGSYDVSGFRSSARCGPATNPDMRNLAPASRSSLAGGSPDVDPAVGCVAVDLCEIGGRELGPGPGGAGRVPPGGA